MKEIPEFNPFDKEVVKIVAGLIECHPVAHLTQEEVTQTLRLIQLEQALTDDEHRCSFDVTVYRHDERLEDLSEDDKFLALLLDCDCRQIILATRQCIHCFGGTPHRWRKVAGRCVLIETKSTTFGGEYGGKYYGRGWAITPYIKRLKKYMEENGYVL